MITWLSWLERYWILSVLSYPAALLGLSLSLRPPWSAVETWAALVTLAFGIATLVAISLEGVIRVFLSIPATIRKIKEEGREEGLREGLREGRREIVRTIEQELAEGRDIQEVLQSLSNGSRKKS